MWPFIAAIGSMFMKDSINTVLIICEARGRHRLAGHLAAASDLANLLVTLASAGLVLRHGWTLQTVGVVVAMMITSDLGTRFWTKQGNRIARNGEQGMQADYAAAQVPELSRRIVALEEKVSK